MPLGVEVIAHFGFVHNTHNIVQTNVTNAMVVQQLQPPLQQSQPQEALLPNQHQRVSQHHHQQQ